MKGFQKLALVAAIAAAPFAQAELVAMDDAVLSEMTGQAGVTIELDTAVTIASIDWTDGDGNAALALAGGTPASGTLSVNTVAFGGATVAGGTGDARFDGIKIDIDVDANDGLVIHLGGTNNVTAIDGTGSVDFGLSVGDVSVTGMTNPLVSNINIAGNLGPVDVKINNSAGLDMIQVGAYFEVTSGGMDVSTIGLGISNLKVGQDSNPFSTGNYSSVRTLAMGLGNGTDDGTKNMAYVGLAIGAMDAVYHDMDLAGSGAAAGDVTVTQAMYVSLNDFNIDVSMDVALGGASIGTVAINDLNMAPAGVPTTLKIYGH